MIEQETSALTVITLVEVHVDRKPVLINVAAIQRFQAYEETSKTEVTFTDGNVLIVDESLEKFQKALSSAIIIRTQTG